MLGRSQKRIIINFKNFKYEIVTRESSIFMPKTKYLIYQFVDDLNEVKPANILALNQ